MKLKDIKPGDLFVWNKKEIEFIIGVTKEKYIVMTKGRIYHANFSTLENHASYSLFLIRVAEIA